MRKTVIVDGWQRDPFRQAYPGHGQQPLIPAIPGVDKRKCTSSALSMTLARCSKRRTAGCKAVVIGGGLLGLEAARGLAIARLRCDAWCI